MDIPQQAPDGQGLSKLERMVRSNKRCNRYINEITLTKEFCAQPIRQVWLIVCTKTEFEKYIECKHIKNLSGFRGLLLIIEVKINFSLGFDDTDYQTNKL